MLIFSTKQVSPPADTSTTILDSSQEGLTSPMEVEVRQPGSSSNGPGEQLRQQGQRIQAAGNEIRERVVSTVGGWLGGRRHGEVVSRPQTGDSLQGIGPSLGFM